MKPMALQRMALFTLKESNLGEICSCLSRLKGNLTNFVDAMNWRLINFEEKLEILSEQSIFAQ